MKIISKIDNLPKYKLYLKILEAVELFFKKNNYLKLDLPVLSPCLIPESYLEVFATKFVYFNKKKKLYLTPSPELFIKRLLTYGLGDCYYLGKAFRNSEPISKLHLPEFNILEFYKVGFDYNFLKKEIRRLLLFIGNLIFKQDKISYEGKTIDLKSDWEKISVTQAFEKFSHIKAEELFSEKRFIKAAKSKGYQIKNASYIDLFSQIYSQEVEPNLGICGRPAIIYDYPWQMAALAKLNPDGNTCQRFEFYINGVELGDCYTELTNWQEQKRRFEIELKKRNKNKQISLSVDWDFIEVLKKKLPECSGMAVGIDRLAMILTNSKNISDFKLININ